MNTRSSRNTCETCSTSRNILYCVECTQLSCANCVDHKSEETWFCNSCGDEATAKTCGSCGSKTKVIQTNLIKICQSCKGNSLGEPETLITQLPSEFFSIASKIKDTYPDLIEVHRKFDFSLTLVRLCRLANLVGFPQIEEHLRKCSIGLQSITERGIEHISRIRKEASFDLRNMDNFKNIELEHYRNANTILQSTYDKINKVNTLMRHWIEQVTIELDQMMRIAGPLRQHYELLTQISRYLPQGISNVVAVLPALPIHLKKKRFNKRIECFMIFAEEVFICLPSSVLDQDNESNRLINGIQFPYSKVQNINTSNSLLKGYQLQIETNEGTLKINNSPIIINGIVEYFELILSGEPYVVGGPKEILEIESNGPDKSKFKRASQKFIDIINEKLFGSSVQLPDRSDKIFNSVSQIQTEYKSLLRKIREIDFLAQNLQIDPQAYQTHRSTFKENMRTIQDSLGSLGGHVVKRTFDDMNLGYNERDFEDIA
ncbi:MAG: hypothetical protein HeimC2_21060 [Candidatus Heimdallarchaeota archaeon LC_2]|nr:MAG: hypothetical protein HeimC2_21060 [Candidatus Heimdallarchaeota archaeon LC_2]